MSNTVDTPTISCNVSNNITDIIKSLGLPNRLMTDVEVAEIKKCSVQTLRNDRHLRRGLPYIKTGRSIRYTPADVAADILANRIDPEAA